MSTPPDCGKCGKAHWTFTRCEQAGRERKKEPPVVIRQPLPEGVRVWGDRFDTMERRGNSFRQPRSVPLEAGGLVYPEGSDVPKTT